VADLIVFQDPARNRLEVFHGPAVAGDPFRPGRPISGFRTGPLGMGHAVLNIKDAEPLLSFYRNLLGFRVSDYVLKPQRSTFSTSMAGTTASQSSALWAWAYGQWTGTALDNANAQLSAQSPTLCFAVVQFPDSTQTHSSVLSTGRLNARSAIFLLNARHTGRVRIRELSRKPQGHYARCGAGTAERRRSVSRHRI
jgi:hypothetical protein